MKQILAVVPEIEGASETVLNDPGEVVGVLQSEFSCCQRGAQELTTTLLVGRVGVEFVGRVLVYLDLCSRDCHATDGVEQFDTTQFKQL